MNAVKSRTDYTARHHYQEPEASQNYDRRRFSTLYGRAVDRLEKRALRRALRTLPPGSVVLELACGTGRMTEVAIRMGYRVLGLDISRGMLDNAVQRVGADPHLIGLVRGQSETIPLETGSVDAVMVCRFLPRLDSAARPQVFREIHRVSRRYAVLQFSSARSVLFNWRVWWARPAGKGAPDHGPEGTADPRTKGRRVPGAPDRVCTSRGRADLRDRLGALRPAGVAGVSPTHSLPPAEIGPRETELGTQPYGLTGGATPSRRGNAWRSLYRFESPEGRASSSRFGR